MFRTASAENRMLIAEGRNAAGQWIAIPLRDFFHYTRGATDLRFYEHSRVFWKKGNRNERAQFAAYLAERMQARGISLTTIRFFWEKTHIENDRIRRQFLGQFLIRGER